MGKLKKKCPSKENQPLLSSSKKISEISSVRNKYTSGRQNAEHNSGTVIQLTSVQSIVTAGRKKQFGRKIGTCTVLTEMRAQSLGRGAGALRVNVLVWVTSCSTAVIYRSRAAVQRVSYQHRFYTICFIRFSTFFQSSLGKSQEC
jgi:hypothetical protein